MITLDLKIENTDAVAAALATLEDMPRFFHPVMGKWVDRTGREYLWGMRNYAPPPAGSTYIRTGRLGDSWSSSELDWSAFVFENRADYAGLVVGEDQAWMHRGRWWRATDRIAERTDELMRDLEEALGRWPNR